MVMTIGELEYVTFFVDKTLYIPDLARVVFLIFCVLMPIVLMNLLVSYSNNTDSVSRSFNAIVEEEISSHSKKATCFLDNISRMTS